jgi:hypothetical protein
MSKPLYSAVLLAVILFCQGAMAAGVVVSPAKKIYAPGDKLSVSYEVRPSKAVRLVRVEAGVDGQRPILKRSFRDWRAGKRSILKFNWTPPSPGRYTLYFNIDPGNRAGMQRRVTQRIVVREPARRMPPVAVTRPAPVAKSLAPSMVLKAPLAKSGGASGSSPSTTNQNCSPDLRVDRVEISPPYPRAQQDYRIKIWVLQFLPSGVTQSPAAFVAVRRAGHTTAIDSKYVQFAQNNSAVTPDFEWTRKEWNGESLEVYVQLDHQNKLHECREDNNEFVQPYTVYAKDQPMADLAFRDHVNFDHKNLVNRNVNLSAELINRGNAKAKPFWVEFVCDDDRDAHTKLTHRQRVTTAIPAGGVVAFNTHMRWSTPGMKVCIVALDKDDEVVESNEYNNEYIGVTLHVDEPPPVR